MDAVPAQENKESVAAGATFVPVEGLRPGAEQLKSIGMFCEPRNGSAAAMEDENAKKCRKPGGKESDAQLRGLRT